MTDRERVCQRAGCAQLASVTLSFRYDARQASLTDLSPQKHPADYDLCGAHADLLSVPRGWERLDRRAPAPDAQLEPEGHVADQGARDGEELRAVAGLAGRGGATRRGGQALDEGVRRPAPANRYAALTAELPRLAAALAAADEGPDGPAAHSYEVVTETMVGKGSWTHGSDASFAERDEVIEGQLQMPIEPEPEGVVVALTRARQV